MLKNDLLALIATLAVALLWLRLNDYLAQRGWVSSHLSRKIIHIGTGPLFVLCWPLFTSAPAARRAPGRPLSATGSVSGGSRPTTHSRTAAPPPRPGTAIPRSESRT